jgi:hypothetical protein
LLARQQDRGYADVGKLPGHDPKGSRGRRRSRSKGGDKNKIEKNRSDRGGQAEALDGGTETVAYS